MIGRVLAFVVLLIACAAAVSGLLLPPLVWLAARTGQRLRVDMWGELAAALLATAIMLRAIDRRPWSDLGMDRAAARLRPMLTGWTLGTAAIAITCGLLAAAGLLRFVPTAVESSWAGAALRVTLFLVPAALAEEVICRGYLLTVLRDETGDRAAVVVTSVLFALLHLGNVGASAESVAVVTLAGIFLGTVRLVLKSLYAAWMAHLAWNWVMAVLLHASVSGIRFESPGYQAVTVGPEWLSGGTWGPEGGLFAALGLLAGLGYFYARRGREES